jgi:preprotein translocase subunit YajC
MIKFFFVTCVYFLGSFTLALAEGPALPAGSGAPAGGAPAQPQQPSAFGMMVPFLLMFAVVYFLMIRPQQKKAKEQQQMLTALKHGDEVVTSSGMLGTITGITDKVVTLEVADNVRVKMLKTQVSQVVKGQLKDLVQ